MGAHSMLRLLTGSRPRTNHQIATVGQWVMGSKDSHSRTIICMAISDSYEDVWLWCCVPATVVRVGTERTGWQGISHFLVKCLGFVRTPWQQITAGHFYVIAIDDLYGNVRL